MKSIVIIIMVLVFPVWIGIDLISDATHHNAYAAFNSCVTNQIPWGQTDGTPVVNGASDGIQDKSHYIAGVDLLPSHALAVANAQTMTGFPMRLVEGSNIITFNNGITSDEAQDIVSCDYKLPGSDGAGQAFTNTSAPSSSATTPAPASTAPSSTYYGPPCSQMTANNAEDYSMCNADDANCPTNWTPRGQDLSTSGNATYCLPPKPASQPAAPKYVTCSGTMADGSSTLTVIASSPAVCGDRQVLADALAGQGVRHEGGDMADTYVMLDGWKCTFGAPGGTCEQAGRFVGNGSVVQSKAIPCLHGEVPSSAPGACNYTPMSSSATIPNVP